MITIDEAKQIVRRQYIERISKLRDAQAVFADRESQTHEWG